ncbi:MAG: hypothetical protein R6V58_00350 [Planctomycetota bacterium]
MIDENVLHVMDYCNDEGIIYTIGADRDPAVNALYESLPDNAWEPMPVEEGERPREVAETVHSLEEGNHSFRLVFVRAIPRQGELFDTGRIRRRPVASNPQGDAISQMAPRMTDAVPSAVIPAVDFRSVSAIGHLASSGEYIARPPSRQAENADRPRRGASRYYACGKGDDPLVRGHDPEPLRGPVMSPARSCIAPTRADLPIAPAAAEQQDTYRKPLPRERKWVGTCPLMPHNRNPLMHPLVAACAARIGRAVAAPRRAR